MEQFLQGTIVGAVSVFLLNLLLPRLWTKEPIHPRAGIFSRSKKELLAAQIFAEIDHFAKREGLGYLHEHHLEEILRRLESVPVE